MIPNRQKIIGNNPFHHGKIFALLKEKIMNTNEEKFPAQDAPIKNTDHAFVQVGKDGQPVIPNWNDGKAPKEQEEKEEETRQP